MAVFLLLFLVLAIVYSWAIPYFFSIDEVSHFEFVKRLVLDIRLPVITQSEYYAAEQHQPPGYYLLSSLAGRVLTGSPLQQAASDMTLVFYAGRGVSVLFGLLTVVGTYLLASQFFGARRLPRIGATAIVALNPSLIAMAGAVNNDSMASAAGVFLLLATVKASQSHLSTKSMLGVGLLAGVAALTKENILPLLLPLALALALMSHKHGGWREFAKTALAVGLPALAVAGWWYLRNLVLYGDLLAWNLNALLSPGNVHKDLPGLESYISVLNSLAQTFWVGFGRTLDVRASWPVYLAIWVGCAIALFGLVRLVRSRRPVSWLQPGRTLGLVFITADLLLLLLADLSYNRAFVGAGAGRYLFPVSGAIAILITFGLSSAVRWKQPWLLGSFCAILLGLSVAAPSLYLFPLRTLPSTVTEAVLKSEAQPAEATFGGSMQLVGYRIGAPRVAPGDNLEVSLYWKAVAGTTLHWTGYAHLIDSQDRIYAQHDSIPLNGAYPTLFWRNGETWREDYQLPVEADAPDGVYRLQVGFYSLQTGEQATVSAQGREWSGGVPLGQIRVFAPEPIAAPKNPLDVSFKDSIRLLGWDQDAGGIVLYWQAGQAVKKDYTVFVHYLDQQSKVIAQDDSRPAEGKLPTSVWGPGETVRDRHRIASPPGTYVLEIGLYDSATNERLPLLAGNDSVLPGPIHVP